LAAFVALQSKAMVGAVPAAAGEFNMEVKRGRNRSWTVAQAKARLKAQTHCR
jgi:hypothetical protein